MREPGRGNEEVFVSKKGVLSGKVYIWVIVNDVAVRVC